MGSLFIPVIPTQSANLAGTASILTQWWIGQGVEAFGFSGVSSNTYRFNNNVFGNHNLRRQFAEKFGGFVEGQYYFNNQWFAQRPLCRQQGLQRVSLPGPLRWSRIWYQQHGNGLHQRNNASTIQQAEATLWYRPIQAIKFGLQYSYTAANYFQMTNRSLVLITLIPAGLVTITG